MSVRRTREEKQRIQTRREQQTYSWQKAEILVEPEKKKELEQNSPLLQQSIRGFGADIRRTGAAFLLCVIVLALVVLWR